ncbi:hypothetical protein BG015_009480 [Linnemannia schmuckeri]|uniref:F-box domain-containing protein n=1 Tax=Linnemannia schmuckeri TaxID=64567 RepID=A0A9P5V9X4_9FUNG|nr:hypothetical protein BG015_009480 [Linnemannia schmuckeri]
MVTISALNIPPEVLERISVFLDSHSLTVSIRVCRLWFDCFLPSLYHTIHIYHFDYFSTDLGAGYPLRSDGIVRTTDTVGYGGKFVHKHGQFIKEVTVGTAYALKYLLGPKCTNLVRVTTVVPGFYAPNVKFRGMSKGDGELESWRGQFGREHDGILIGQIWEPLLLEELHIKFMRDWDIVEALLDYCPQVDKIVIETFTNRYSDPTRPSGAAATMTRLPTSPKTCIKELNLFSSGRMCNNPWIIPVLWRCPLLERLIVPSYRPEWHFGPVMRTIIEHCPEILYLHIRIQERFTSIATITALDDLLNTGCTRLTWLRLYNAADIFLMERHFWSRDLRARLEKFWCSARSKRLLEGRVLGAEVGFGVLLVCPNLRVFEARRMMLDVEEFLGMEFACLESLEVLHARLRYRSRTPPIAATALEGDEKEVEAKERYGDGGGKTKQLEETEGVARLYRQNIQDKVIHKLAQFKSLKELHLSEDCSKGKDDGGDRPDVFHFDMGEGEGGEGKIHVFVEKMPLLRSLCIDGLIIRRS